MSPARKAPVEEAVTEPGPVEEPEKLDRETVVGWVKEAVADILGSGDKGAEPGPGANEIEEAEPELESPRQQEARARREVERAIGSLHLHVEQPKGADEKKASEPEEKPGRKSWLQRVVNL